MAFSEPDDWLQVDASLGFERPELVAMLALWRDRCRDGRLPARADFEPRDFAGHLGWIVLADVEQQPLRFRYRLIGTQVTAMAGRDMSGRYLDEIYPPEILRIVTAGYRAARDDWELFNGGMLMIRDCIALAGENRPALATAAE